MHDSSPTTYAAVTIEQMQCASLVHVEELKAPAIPRTD
jgi:hypothetical protein